MIEVQQTGAGVARIEIANPPANALGRAARVAFHAALDAIAADETLRVLLVTGRGKSFCSGDDLKEQEAAQAGGHAARMAQLGEFAALVERVGSFPKPVIAAINGHCMGGGLELALACDIRIAAERASFVCAGVNVGLMASAWRLPRLIGEGRARHMLLTGLPFDAVSCERFGLVTAVHPDDKLAIEAEALAARIASRAPLSVAATRSLVSQAHQLSASQAGERTRAALAQLVSSDDHAEALRAFREKRPPLFNGR